MIILLNQSVKVHEIAASLVIVVSDIKERIAVQTVFSSPNLYATFAEFDFLICAGNHKNQG